MTKFDGLIVDFCKANDISAIVKGLRAVSDFDYELQMAQMNYNQAGVETLFISTNPLWAFLSSSLVKEFAKYGGDVTSLVPEPVLGRLTARSGRFVTGSVSPGATPPEPPPRAPTHLPFPFHGQPPAGRRGWPGWDSRRQPGMLTARYPVSISVCHATRELQKFQAAEPANAARLRYPDPWPGCRGIPDPYGPGSG